MSERNPYLHGGNSEESILLVSEAAELGAEVSAYMRQKGMNPWYVSYMKGLIPKGWECAEADGMPVTLEKLKEEVVACGFRETMKRKEPLPWYVSHMMVLLDIGWARVEAKK